jgi:bloom syndrome protein
LHLPVQKGGGSYFAGRPKKTIRAAKETVADAVPAPQSTYLSSPLRGTAKRKKAKAKSRQESILEEDDDDEQEAAGLLHANGYEKDGFVIGNDDEDDYFDPPPKPTRRRRQQTLDELGPPIARDTRIDEASIDDIQQGVVEAFIEQAKDLDENIRNKNGLHRTLFTEQQYREMCIYWATDLDKIHAIPGVNQDNVQKFGPKFIKLLKDFHASYKEMMGKPIVTTRAASVKASHKTSRTVSGNHDIVDLISSDGEEAEEDYGLDDLDDEDEGEDDEVLAGESSKYFAASASRQSHEVEDWHTAFAQMGTSVPKSKGGKKSGRGGAGKGKKWYPRGGSSGGVTKRKSSTGSTRRSSGSASTRGGADSGSRARASSASTGTRGGASGAAKRVTVNSGISTMPF